MVSMKKVLVTGGTGLLGANLILDWQERFELSSVQLEGRMNFKIEKQANFDLGNKEEVMKFVGEIKPDAVVHTAALVNVDFCEGHRPEAFAANAIATENVAEACSKEGAKLVFVSTDSVFDGSKGNYSEEDKTNPPNVYAESKLEAEKLALEKNSNTAVVRTSIYGWNAQPKESLSEWIYNSLKEGRKLNLFEDVFFTPILVNDFGEAVAEIIENDFKGILHVAGGEKVSKLGFGEKVADVFGFGNENIFEGSIDDSNLVAKRPKDASLNVEKAGKVLKMKLPNVKEGLERKKKLLENGFVEKLKGGFKQ